MGEGGEEYLQKVTKRWQGERGAEKGDVIYEQKYGGKHKYFTF